MRHYSVKKILFLIVLVLTSLSGSAQNPRYHRIEAKIPKEIFQEIMQSGLEIDHFEYKNEVLVAELSDQDIKLLKLKKIKVKYLIRNLSENIEKHNKLIDRQAKLNPSLRAVTVPTPVNFGTGGSYGPAGSVAYHFTFQEMQNELDAMRALFPNLITVKSSIGTTDQGRQLYVVRISDNADVDENEPEVFLNAVHHAREPISMTQLIFLMWHLLENYNSDKEIQTLLNSTEIYALPCVNPDGYVYNQTNNPTGGGFWRKNRHNNGNGTFGVDNNRNYSFGWGGSGSSTSTSSDTYRGTAPFSEAENIAIRNFVNSRQFVTEYNYHAYGNFCVYPYSYVETNTNPEISFFNQLSVFLTEDNAFAYGNSTQTVNYVASGGAEDWAYGEQVTKGKMYGFTPEVGASTDGFYPASSRIIPLCNSMIVMNKNLLKVSTKYGVVTTTAPASISNINGSVPFSIKNFSIYPATYTITLNPLTPYITNVDAPKVISSSVIFQVQNNQFNFTVDPATPTGTNLSFEVLTFNTYTTRKDTINILYNCQAPTQLTTTGIGLNEATLGWTAVNGVTDYLLTYKAASAQNWNPEIPVNGTTKVINGLQSNTEYNWRVHSNTCSAYSGAQTFNTLQPCIPPSPSITAVMHDGFILSWPEVDGALSYTIHSKQQGAGSWTSSTVNSTLRVLNSLSSNTTYEFEVAANCQSFNSSFSTIQDVTTSQTTTLLNLKMLIEGFYESPGSMRSCLNLVDASSDNADVDIVTVSLMNASSPYGLVESQTGILKSNGDVTVNFSQSVPTGNSYYLKISHRNAIETWSKNPVLLSQPTTYSFISDATQAFGDNEKLTDDFQYYTFYSGDINQDQSIDATDFILLDPLIQNGKSGYSEGDFNGDGSVDATDFLVLDPNIQNGVGSIFPVP